MFPTLARNRRLVNFFPTRPTAAARAARLEILAPKSPTPICPALPDLLYFLVKSEWIGNYG